jgi:molybdenum cofactor guanylyltransferase
MSWVDTVHADTISQAKITGVILAGGRATRMGGMDKGLVVLNGIPMLEHILATLRPQVGDVLINANRNIERYADYGYKVVPDMLGDYFGPLAGMASAMQAAGTEYILTVPCDSPLLPSDLAVRLAAALTRDRADIGVAHDGERMQPVFSLLRCNLLASMLAYLNSGERKIDLWYAKHKLAIADFTDSPETFLNVNTPEDRAALEAKLAEAG